MSTQNDIGTILATLTAMMEAQADPKVATAQAEEQRASNLPKARQFSSLGFVVVGDGEKPDTGDVLQVPTKAGKVARVKTIAEIDTTPFNGEFGDWAFTYKRLKRGEE